MVWLNCLLAGCQRRCLNLKISYIRQNCNWCRIRRDQFQKVRWYALEGMISSVVARDVKLEHDLYPDEIRPLSVEQGFQVLEIFRRWLEVNSCKLEDASYATDSVGDRAARQHEPAAHARETVVVEFEDAPCVALDGGPQCGIGKHVAGVAHPGVLRNLFCVCVEAVRLVPVPIGMVNIRVRDYSPLSPV